MRARTPATSAEMAIEEWSRLLVARRHGRAPERLPLQDGYAPLAIEGPLPPGHPLADTPAEARRKRVEMERARRGL